MNRIAIMYTLFYKAVVNYSSLLHHSKSGLSVPVFVHRYICIISYNKAGFTALFENTCGYVQRNWWPRGDELAAQTTDPVGCVHTTHDVTHQSRLQHKRPAARTRHTLVHAPSHAGASAHTTEHCLLSSCRRQPWSGSYGS